MKSMFIFQILSTYGLLSLIWLVQRLIYPSFLIDSDRSWHKIHDFHCKRISEVVIPLMLIELLSAIFLLISPYGISFNQQLSLVFCSLVAWLSTFLIQVPLHNSLKEHFDIIKLRSLNKTNWIRTFAWSLKAVLLTCFLL
jgi:hypothetical protein